MYPNSSTVRCEICIMISESRVSNCACVYRITDWGRVLMKECSQCGSRNVSSNSTREFCNKCVVHRYNKSPNSCICGGGIDGG